MKKLENGQVRLTAKEREIHNLFKEIVAEGDLGHRAAAQAALSAVPTPDPEFVVWLSAK